MFEREREEKRRKQKEEGTLSRPLFYFQQDFLTLFFSSLDLLFLSLSSLSVFSFSLSFFVSLIHFLFFLSLPFSTQHIHRSKQWQEGTFVCSVNKKNIQPFFFPLSPSPSLSPSLLGSRIFSLWTLYLSSLFLLINVLLPRTLEPGTKFFLQAAREEEKGKGRKKWREERRKRESGKKRERRRKNEGKDGRKNHFLLRLKNQKVETQKTNKRKGNKKCGVSEK